MNKILSILIFLIVTLPSIGQSNASDALYSQAMELVTNGQYKKALPLLEQVLALDKETDADNLEIIISDRQWLAYTHFKLGDTQAAKTYQRTCYDLQPADRRLMKADIGYSLNAFGATSPEMALYWAEKSLAEEKRVLGEHNLVNYNTRAFIANLYYQMGDSVQCRRWIEEAKNTAKHIKSETTAWKSSIYALETSLEYQLGNISRALELADSIFSWTDADVLASPFGYNDALQVWAMENLKSAPVKVDARIKNTTAQILSANAEEMADCYTLARFIIQYYLQTGQAKDALKLSEYAVSLTQEYPSAYPYFLFDYGVCLSASGLYEKSLDVLNKASGFAQKNDFDRAETLLAMAACENSLRRYADAEKHLQKALSIFKKLPELEARMISTLQQLAANATYRNEFESAVSYLSQTLECMDRSGMAKPSDYAYMHREMGACLSALKDESAKEHYQIAIDYLAQQESLSSVDHFTKIDCILNPIEEEADTSFVSSKITDLINELDDHTFNTAPQLCKIFNWATSYYFNRLYLDKALDYSNLCLELGKKYPSLDIWESQVMKVRLLALLYRTDEAWELLDDTYHRAKETAKENPQRMISAITNAIECWDATVNLSRTSQMIEMSEDLLNLAHNLQISDPLYFHCLITAARGILFAEPQRSIDILEKALSKIPKDALEAHPVSLINAHVVLTSLYRNMGQLEKSYVHAKKLIELAEKYPDYHQTAYAYSEAGQTFLALNRLKDAELTLLKSETLYKNLNSEIGTVLFVYENLAKVYAKMGQQDKATEYANKRMDDSRFAIGDVMEISRLILWLNSGFVPSDEAYQAIQKIEEFSKNNDTLVDQSVPHRFYALYFSMLGENAVAQAQIDIALSIFRTVDNLKAAVIVYDSAGMPETAENLGMELIKLQRRLNKNSSIELFEPYCLLANTTLKANHFERSNAFFRSAFESGVKYIEDNLLTLTSAQRADFWQMQSPFYFRTLPNIAVNYPIGQAMNELLYDAALFGSGLLLGADNTIGKVVAQSSPHVQDMYAQYAAAKGQLSQTKASADGTTASEERIKGLQAHCDTLEHRMMLEIRTKHPNLLTYKNYRWKDVQKNLPAKGAAIEYIDFQTDTINNAVAALVLRKGWKAPEFRVLYHYPRGKKFGINDTYTNTVLGDSLLTGLADLLDGCQEVYFAPQGLICSVALESLPRSENPLLDNINLYRISSTRTLAEKKPRRKDFQASLFGGLNYNTSVDLLKKDAEKYPELRKRDFIADNFFRAKREGDADIAPLPGTLKEVVAIDSLLKADMRVTPTLRVGNDGTETALKALSGKFGSILHVSTHGFYNDGAVSATSASTFEDEALDQSGLLMAGASHRYVDEMELPDNLDDGILKSSEIAKLDLSGVDLAVLSACETGLGAVTGDGVFGLQRGFKKGGVNSILMSLWKVDDDATCALMDQFYRNWLGGKTKHESLELAKAHVRSHPDWQHPRFWASFILLDAIN